MADRVTLLQQTSALRSQFNKFDESVQTLFDSLDKALEDLSSEDYSHNQKFDIVIGAEYLVVRVRAKILLELSRIQTVISAPTTPTGVEKLFRDRYSTVVTMCQRLNELREDFSVVQRSMWARNAGRL